SLAISLELSLHEIELLLRKHGYCLSKSLPNDMVVLWFLKNTNKYKNNCCLIQNINNTLYELNLPQLMTKLINR
ncbi:MAG: hypothetical protein LBM93_01700, partial [Oscillospiraceae bacterium]|nr:hypothetical protein [Oscillospiraceae bacterium]